MGVKTRQGDGVRRARVRLATSTTDTDRTAHPGTLGRYYTPYKPACLPASLPRQLVLLAQGPAAALCTPALPMQNIAGKLEHSSAFLTPWLGES